MVACGFGTGKHACAPARSAPLLLPNRITSGTRRVENCIWKLGCFRLIFPDMSFARLIRGRPAAYFCTASASLVVVVAVMFGFFPYGSGWGSQTQSVIHNLTWMWRHSPEWEHCMLVPLICIGMIWWERKKLEGVPIQGDSYALIFLLLGVAVFWIGYQIDLVVFSFFILHGMIGASIWWLFGWRFLRAILFPVAFLFFAWPVPALDSEVAFPLRNVMAGLSYHFLNLIGLDVIRSGTAILSAPDHAYGIAQGAKFAVDIADPCSGIRSLFALTMISALYAYFMMPQSSTFVQQRKEAATGPAWKKLAWDMVTIFTDHWRAWLVFLAAAPLAVLGNFFRILMLTFGTLLLGSETAIGTLEEPSFYHMLSGFVVFAVALAGLVAWGWLLDGGFGMLQTVFGQLVRGREGDRVVAAKERHDANY